MSPRSQVKPPARAGRAAALLLAGVLALAGCAPCRDAQLAQLYFGRGLPGGGEVSDSDWAGFVARELAPRFPDGFTVIDAAGAWRDPATGAVVRERTKLVQIAGPAGAGARQRLDAVRAAYKAAFSQSSVGLVTTPSCAEF